MEACRVDCKFKGECTRHCEDNAGYALSKFLSSIDVCETTIGDYILGGKYFDCVVTGIQLEFGVRPSHLLVNISNDLDISEKFIPMFGKTVTKLLDMYLTEHSSSYSEEATKSLKSTLSGVRTNKLVVSPLKPDLQCEVRPNGKDDENVYHTKIHSLIWRTSTESGRFECSLVTDVCELEHNKRHKILIRDYGTKIRLSKIERTMYSLDIDRRLVQMTDCGFVRPISVTDVNGVTLALDGAYMYQVVTGGLAVVGYWDGAELLVAKEYKVSNSEAYKHIQRSIGYIRDHKRFIAPYGTVIPSVITL